MPWRVVPATFPEILRAVPKQGEAKADEFLKKHRKVLQRLIAAARLEQQAPG